MSPSVVASNPRSPTRSTVARNSRSRERRRNSSLTDALRGDILYSCVDWLPANILSATSEADPDQSASGPAAGIGRRGGSPNTGSHAGFEPSAVLLFTLLTTQADEKADRAVST